MTPLLYCCRMLPAAVLLLVNATVMAHSEGEHGRSPDPLAPGYGELPFAAPKPGSYELPPLGHAPDGAVLTAGGKPARLHDYLGGKIVLLSLMYTSCNDVNGCPLATFVMSRVRDRLLADGQLGERVRLVSLSFDPPNDTPAVLRDYAASFRRPGDDWAFLTTASRQALSPILDGLGQGVTGMDTPEGRQLAHVLRVYLIDGHRRIRNIYSVSFLHPEILIADIQTLIGTR